MSESTDNNTAAVPSIDALKLEEKEDFVDPWNVESQSDTGIDYDKLIRKHSVWVGNWMNECLIRPFFLFIKIKLRTIMVSFVF